MQDTLAYKFFSLAGIIGFVGPAIIGLAILILGIVRKDISIRVSAWMFTQASFLGWLLSSTMKVFTGRIQPPNEIIDNIIAVSHGFRFGFMEGGIYWGWPSSHTATAFAGCIALVVYYRDNVWLRYIALSYATYIAAGASMSFHWLSDVLVGIILGTGIGIAIGSSFQRKAKAKEIEKKDYR